uniref:DNA 5'-3' helicase n=1 Tax=Aceria tosichella TaxID=561515 RepID=A0A6G1SHA2_9ACAR
MGQAVNPGQSVKLGGLDVEFPYKPYGIQRAMMARIIVAYTNKQNCLIESPTGTGKSLSLICSSLAWQQRSKLDSRPFVSASYSEKQVAERMAKLKNRPCTCGSRPDAISELDELKNAKKGQKGCEDIDNDESSMKKLKLNPDRDETSPHFQQANKNKLKQKQPEMITIDSDDDDVNATQIITPSKYSDIKPKVCKIEDEVEFLDDTDNTTFRKPLSDSKPNNQENPDGTALNEMCKNCLAIKSEQEFVNEMGPGAVSHPTVKKIRIYYGTRTHKQIAQIVRELKKTSYTKDLKMNILSSRDRTCVNEDVRDLPTRNDKCQELVKNKSKAGSSNRKSNLETCQYYRDGNQMAADFALIYQEKETFDIEDAVEFGKQFCICPYYGMRALQDEADITFCPYNYILDPNIRSAMQINLRNSIIILDEAHNIEDICRDSASFVINTQQIDEILANINRASFNYIQGSSIREAYDFFKNLFTDLKAFLIKFNFVNDKFSRDGDCLARKVMLHHEMMSSLSAMNFGSKHVQSIRDNLKALRGDEDESGDKSSKDKRDEGQDGALNNQDLQVITQLTNTLEFIYSQENKNSSDYRCIVSKHLDRGTTPMGRNNNRSMADNDVYLYQFSLICMNPAIAFQKIHENCWSVVVASGTLSPIESLKTELGCNFNQVFEGSHVIPDDRIFSTILSNGPNGIDLNCSYANSLRLDFQDELGQVVRDVCRVVPSGVLIFFPSYDRMENLYQRWFTKGYINDITSAGKKIHREQKNFTSTKFDEELKKYHRAATGKGAVMMAVYRGKISEGIDFSDSAARAVISIGIPYPNIKEVTIGLKREYNDLARKNRPELMNGSMWYQTQAMRALNQSLGRVIRHKDDWGAIIMLDSRLRSSQCMSGISKWVRRCITPQTSYEIFRSSLQDFVALREGDASN